MKLGYLIDVFVNVGFSTEVIVRDFKYEIIERDVAVNLMHDSRKVLQFGFTGGVLDVVLFNEECRK